MLDKDGLKDVRARISADLGACDILINGAGGNSPKCTTDKERYEDGDLDSEGLVTFFSLDKSGFDFVFGLNLMGTLLPTQYSCPSARPQRLLRNQYFLDERLYAADQDPGVQRRKAPYPICGGSRCISRGKVSA